jgi:hypothetical protein
MRATPDRWWWIAANAEPVGLFFAGGVDTSGVSEGVANPVSDVLSELSAQVGGGTNRTLCGHDGPRRQLPELRQQHGEAAQARALSDAETARAQQALGRRGCW